ncbi:hypothetical protein [Cytobacillus firmus]|uniref:Uncharacterized protein n=1 Tax=Cytobacillus firmus DS1 TaxID=1307436 RepID=W7KUQ0_CYTFI|nr:hypothetical protein [Cytobacillus firmus]EWG11180.1 hypothetical protein PBF_09147 [Cytobacillus firmus DS1]
MNIGLGLLLAPIAFIFMALGTISLKKRDRLIGNGLLIAGAIFLLGSVILLAGLYDPYSNHIR